MIFPQAFLSLAALLAFSPATQAFITPCNYQEYVCGYTLMNTVLGYNETELTTAVNRTSTVPPLNSVQLTQVLYRCDNTFGELIGNSYCIAGCISVDGATENDMCAM